MSTKTLPTIPPRPSRSPLALSAHGSEMPKIPARPVNRRLERSVSPSRDSYAPSPLNEAPVGSNLGRTVPSEASSSNLPARSPSVSLPSLGEEGMEYADLQYQ